MKAKKKTDIKNSLFKIGRYLLGLSIVLLSAYYIFFSNKPAENDAEVISTPKEEVKYDEYITYANNTYGYKVRHKRLLIPKKISTDRYLDFVVFFTDRSDNYGGFAISVRENSLKEEIMLIKEELNKGISSTLMFEEDMSEGENRIVRLSYDPTPEEDAEEKDVVIINNGNYSYSISARTKDMGEILNNFSVLELE